MSNSLRDQLLQAGFKTSPNKVNSSKNTKKRSPNLAHLYKQRSKLENKERAEEIKEHQKLAKLRKKNKQKIKQLILKNHIKRKEANIRYNFVVGSSIKCVYVTEEQQTALSASELGITFLAGKRYLLPIDIIEKIKQIDPKKIIVVL